MEYSLAKELKDAGFPQASGFHASNAKNCDCNTKGLNTSCHLAYIPTLSELIEACGDEFDELKKRGDIYFAFASTKTVSGLKIDPFLSGGKTPTEAVANLWLALNKK